MFQNCKELKYLDVSSLDTSDVDNMSYMFDNCKSLISLNLTYFNTQKVYRFDLMLFYYTSLI